MATLKGKTLFVTGASRGIGAAIAERAARDGANIAVVAKTARKDPKLPDTIHISAQAIEKAGGNALPLAVDIRDADAVAATAHAILTRPARACTGRHFTDEEALAEAGMTDFDAYAVKPGVALATDLFLES